MSVYNTDEQDRQNGGGSSSDMAKNAKDAYDKYKSSSKAGKSASNAGKSAANSASSNVAENAAGNAASSATGGAAGSAAGAGAAAGSVAPGIGNAVGAAVGAAADQLKDKSGAITVATCSSTSCCCCGTVFGAIILFVVIFVSVILLPLSAVVSSDESVSYSDMGDYKNYIGENFVPGEINWPLNAPARISSNYGYRWHPIRKTWKLHAGIDIAVPTGTPVYAANGGTIITHGFNSGGYGWYVDVNHGNGKVTRYAHLSAVKCKNGDVVSAGQLIALSGNTGGSTGPHLHFEVRVNGKPQQPLNYVLVPKNVTVAGSIKTPVHRKED